MDEEAVNTLISEAMWKLIQIICEDKTKIKEIRKKKKSKYSVIAQERFIKLYDRVENFKLPKGYNFRIEGKKIAPNFMQKLNTILLLDKKRFLNLSGCGAGKTLSAVISSRLIKNSV